MITNYTELKQAVTDFTHRSDLDTHMDTFVQLAESMIDKQLRSRHMELIAPISFTDRFLALPDDYLAMRAIQINDDSDQGRTAIQQVPPQYLDTYYRTTSGGTGAFAVHGGMIELDHDVDPSEPVDGEMSYYAKVPTLVSNATNDVLTSYPLIYLSAMLMQAHAFTQNTDEHQKWSGAYQMNIEEANKTAEEGRYVLPTIKLGA